MLLDLSNPLDVEKIKTRVDFLIKKKKVVDLTEKKPQRSIQQNRYLHVILGYFGCQTGDTLEYVKREYFKILVNPKLFIIEKQDKFLGKIKILRSSSDLNTEEMTTAIERFRNWSAGEAGVYLPSPEDSLQVQQMEIEIEHNKRFI
jgi:hypothetical protein